MVFSSWSSLFCNASARDKRHKCDTSEERATQVRHERREWVCWERDKSAKQTTRVQHECYTNDTSVTRVKNSDFYNDTSENIFFHPILAAWQTKDYKERNNFILRTTFLKCLISMLKCVWIVDHKNWIL